MRSAIKTYKHNIYYGCFINTTDFPVVNVYVTNYPVVKLLVVELSIWSNWTALIVCDIVRKRK